MRIAATRNGFETNDTQWLFRCCRERISMSVLVETRVSDHATIHRRAGGSARPYRNAASGGSASDPAPTQKSQG